MRKFIIIALISALSLTAAFARENIQEGEQSGIPDRADSQKEVKTSTNQEVKSKKKEVRENQEETDPVFYDSTTSPKEMEEKKNSAD